MQFKVGEKAVYPAHGVGVIKAIESSRIEGIDTTYYVLKILDNGMTIMVPVQNAAAIGMRQIMDVSYIERIMEILQDRETPTDNQTWNRRYREYMTKIKTGDPLEVAKVLRDLAIMKMEKNLSFGERKMYDQARTLLVQEMACARNLEEAQVAREIDGLFVPPEGAKPAADPLAEKPARKGRGGDDDEDESEFDE